MKPLDMIDRTILTILQEDARISNADLARRVNLSPPAVHARVQRLEEDGVIRDYVARLDHQTVGFDMLCFVHISLQLHTTDQVAQFRGAISAMPEVLECHHVTGEFDYLLKVVVRNRKDLQRFIIDRLTPFPGMARIHTSVVLDEVKQESALPVGEDNG